MIRRLLLIALNPFFQAFVVAVAIILFVPMGLAKYTIEQVDMTTNFDHSQFIFADLDHDGISERIHTFYNESGNVGLVIKVMGIPDEQINFRGIYRDKSPRMMIGDYNKDGRDEVYLFTLSDDSIFLHSIGFGKPPRRMIDHRCLARVGKNLADPDYMIIPGKVTDMTGDGYGDLVFAINTGFSRQPRNVFVYDIMKDSLRSSPVSGAYIGGIFLDNLDEDPFDEIMLYTSATDNYMEDPVPYSDSSSWLMVLDHTLEFMFPPVEFQGKTGEVVVFSSMPDFREKILFGSTIFQPSTQLVKKLFYADLEGNVINEKTFSYEDPLFLIKVNPPIQGMDPGKILGYVETGGFYEIDTDLNMVKVSNSIFTRWAPRFLDIDQNGSDEILLLQANQQKHQILRYDFTDPVEMDFTVQSTSLLLSVKLNGDLPPQLSVQGDQVWKLFDYGINPVHRFRFLIWMGIYLVILGFILAIRKLYFIQIKKRYETERMIATLQLAGIKTQMEPHFIFNVINSIGSSIYQEQKDQAYQLVVRFSNMVRSLLSTSDKLVYTLKEEVDFARNFLELEKTRFPALFTYSINIDDEIDPDRLIPKMLIQLHVENALKHGIRPKGFDGLLQVDVKREADYMKIEVRDNGVGRNAEMLTKTDSTGKGMKILQQFFETYNKHNRLPIKQHVTDLFNDDKTPSGTLVETWVPLEFNERIY
jgi:signal transduction histidine kinase